MTPALGVALVIDDLGSLISKLEEAHTHMCYSIDSRMKACTPLSCAGTRYFLEREMPIGASSPAVWSRNSHMGRLAAACSMPKLMDTTIMGTFGSSYER